VYGYIRMLTYKYCCG